MKTLDRRRAPASSLFLAFPYSFAQGIWRHFDTMKVESNPGREGDAMKKPSFADMKLALEEACEFLRSFTLGRYGFTQKDGVAGIQRVTDHCNRMEKLFADGPDAARSKMIVASARPKVSAAEARLAVLRRAS
jgi:hypothetical protein